MFEMIIPKEKFRHPENEEKIYEALDEYYRTDVIVEEDREKLMAVLADEPEILAMLED